MPIPRFGPEAAWAVLLPAEEPPAPELPEGRRKAPKAFRVPGGRAQATVTTRTVSDGTVLRDGGARALVVQSTGKTVTNAGRGGSGTKSGTKSGTRPATKDGAAEIAAALLDADVLKESDWCGGLERTVRRGLARWADQVMGAGSYRFFGPLELVYTDDAPAYSTGARMGRWSEYFRARADKPVGFFALRWQEDARPVHVRRTVAALEAAWPGYGAGVIELIQGAAVSGINGHTFLWGREFIKMGEAQHTAMLRRWERRDQNPFAEASDGPLDPSAFGFGDPTSLPGDLTLKVFHAQVPEAVCRGGWHLGNAQRIAETAPRQHPELAPIAEAVLALWDACRACGKTFAATNHMPLMHWQMRMMAVEGGRTQWLDVPRLFRAPAFYTVWDEGEGGKVGCEEAPPDLMGRLTDDHTHACKESWTYSDLTWMHAFQVGHSCPDPGGASKELAARARAVRKAVKGHPELLAWNDPDYVPGPMPDGGLVHAVEALRLSLGIVRALDALLTLLHRPATLAERSRAGLL